jgi:hypothetical protein
VSPASQQSPSITEVRRSVAVSRSPSWISKEIVFLIDKFSVQFCENLMPLFPGW